jgi:hypothetical protein
MTVDVANSSQADDLMSPRRRQESTSPIRRINGRRSDDSDSIQEGIWRRESGRGRSTEGQDAETSVRVRDADANDEPRRPRAASNGDVGFRLRQLPNHTGESIRNLNCEPIDRHASSPPVTNRGHRLQVPSFNGRSSLKAFLVKFHNYRQTYALDNDQSALFLQSLLTDDAERILNHVTPDSSLQDVLDLLNMYFAESDDSLQSRQQLKCLRQNRQQTLQQLYLEVNKLGSQGYSESDRQSHMYDELLRDSYISAINDRTIQMRLLEANLSNVHEAHKMALKLKTLYDSFPDDRRCMRTVQQDIDRGHNDSQQIELLQAKVDNMSRALQSLIHENRNVSSNATALAQPEVTNARQHLSRRDKPLEKKSRSCYFCHQTGHLQRNCPKRVDRNHAVTGQKPLQAAPIADNSQIREVATQRPACHCYFTGELITACRFHKRRCKSLDCKGRKRCQLQLVADTGAQISLLPMAYIKYAVGQVTPIHQVLTTAGDYQLVATQSGRVKMLIQGKTFLMDIAFSADISQGIARLPFLEQNDAVWCTRDKTLQLGPVKIPLMSESNTSRVRCVYLLEKKHASLLITWQMYPFAHLFLR